MIDTYINKELKTDWYPKESLPVHEGWYERDYGQSGHREVTYLTDLDWFDGKKFMVCYVNNPSVGTPAVTQRPWRGLKIKVTT